MNQKIKFIGLVISLLFLIVMNLKSGSIELSFQEMLDLKSSGKDFIFYNLRAPKTLLALFSGAGLALSGLYMQSVFRNPLAGPYVLGISSGSSLGVALVVLGASFLGAPLLLSNPWTISIAAFIGAFFILGMVMLASRWIKDTLSILIIGLMMGSFSAAIISLLSFYAPAESLKKYILWGMGNLHAVPWELVHFVWISVLIGLFIGLFHLKSLNAFILGDQAAESLGISFKKGRNSLFIATSLMTGCISAAAGPIAFLGLAMPHIARILFKTSDHKVLIPASALLGANCLLFCDLLASLPGQSGLLPINSMTSLIGAPIVIYLMLKKNKLIL
ncbi:MAG: iron chelate uptake ABC transporter family permease subunit [Flavobacteriaceae bacterium]